MTETDVQADLAAWLLACLDYDEQGARGRLEDVAQYSQAEIDPERVLADCAFKRKVIEMFPTSGPQMEYGGFAGFQARDCGEHRTVGPHRAWCHDCNEWCYPDAPCVRCHGVSPGAA